MPIPNKVVQAVIDADRVLGICSPQLTANNFGSVYVPESLQGELMHSYANRKEEFLNRLVKLVKAGNTDAISLLALLFFNRVLNDGERDLECASALAAVADGAGVAYGSYILGLVNTASRKYSIAVRYFDSAASQDFAPAQWMAGWMRHTGRGVEPDPVEASVQYLAAAKNGYVFGYVTYAELARTGCFGAARMFTARLFWPWHRIVYSFRNRFSSRVFAMHLLPSRIVEIVANARVSGASD